MGQCTHACDGEKQRTFEETILPFNSEPPLNEPDLDATEPKSPTTPTDLRKAKRSSRLKHSQTVNIQNINVFVGQQPDLKAKPTRGYSSKMEPFSFGREDYAPSKTASMVFPDHSIHLQSVMEPKKNMSQVHIPLSGKAKAKVVAANLYGSQDATVGGKVPTIKSNSDEASARNAVLRQAQRKHSKQ